MTRLYRILAIVVLAVVVLTVANHCYQNSVSEWEARIERIQGQLAAERKLVETTKKEAAEIIAAVNERADSLAARAPEIRTRIIEVQAETPDSLRGEPAIVQRDSIIADLREEADGWRSAFERQREASAKLAAALEIVEASRDSLAAAVADRPGERPWYLPRIGVGPYAGVDATGRPSAGPVAVTLNWEIKL